MRGGGPNADPIPCAFCHGYGDVCDPGNADPFRAVDEWLAPVPCPRCGCTGKDPRPSSSRPLADTESERVSALNKDCPQPPESVSGQEGDE